MRNIGLVTLGVFASILLLACNNKIDISKSTGVKSYTFKAFSDSVATLSFSNKDSISQAVTSAFGGKAPDVVSHLAADKVLLANLRGKSLIIDVAQKRLTEVQAVESAGTASDWRISFDKEFYWGVSGGKLQYKGSGAGGDDISTVENDLSEILEGQSGNLKPLAVSSTHLIALSDARLVVLSSVPQLRREAFLALDASSLANNPASAVKSGGRIGERGFWLQVDTYLVYLLKNGASSLSSQFSRLPELRSDKGVLTNIKMSGFFESDENSTISQTGQLLIYSAGQVFTAGQEQIVAGAPDDGDKREGPDDTDSGDDNTPTPTPTPTPNVVTLEQLQTAYNNKFKALIDTRCAGCHASRPSKWGSFADVKIFADQGRGRVNDGSMPRGGTLSNTEKTELTQFLDSLAKLP